MPSPTHFGTQNIATKKQAIIVGAGVGGLAIAIRLAIKGYAVNVYERNAYPGGKLSAFERDGYLFDAGPSLFTQPANIVELFELAGEPIQNYFEYEKVPIACRYFFEDGKIINAYTDKNLFAQELQDVVGENPKAVIDYLQTAERAYLSIGNIFLHFSLHKINTWFHKRIFAAIRATKLAFLTSSMHQYHTRKFKSAHTIQLFDRFATYNGSNPYHAPAMLSMIPHLEQNEGTFYPKGGMISITNALHKLAVKLGVVFEFDASVDQITHENGNVTGVFVNGKHVVASLVVTNSDVYYLYRDLIEFPKAAAKTLKRERSSSALIFYWGIKKEFPQLLLHNIFFSNNYAEEFKQLFETKTIIEDPTVYINITAKQESGQAPLGKENWFVMINAPADEGQNWAEWHQIVKANVIKKLSRILGEDISEAIETEQILDPKGIEIQTQSYKGSLYGTSSNSTWAAFLRHPNFSTSLKGLYCTGGSVHPGGGIPLSLKSAKIVSELIQ